MTSTVSYLLFGVSKVFVLSRLDRCGLCRGCGRVWFWALSKWSSVSGIRRTWGVFLHLPPVLQWPLVQPALWPLRPFAQSLPARFHLPDTLQWNGLLQMPSWWVNTPQQPQTNSPFFGPLLERQLHRFVQLVTKGGQYETLKKLKTDKQKWNVKHLHQKWF